MSEGRGSTGGRSRGKNEWDAIDNSVHVHKEKRDTKEKKRERAPESAAYRPTYDDVTIVESDGYRVALFPNSIPE